jgi:hypothetical protein
VTQVDGNADVVEIGKSSAALTQFPMLALEDSFIAVGRREMR